MLAKPSRAEKAGRLDVIPDAQHREALLGRSGIA
jgi:hypothetical protein